MSLLLLSFPFNCGEQSLQAESHFSIFERQHAGIFTRLGCLYWSTLLACHESEVLRYVSPRGSMRRISHWFSYAPKNLSIISTLGTLVGLQIREVFLFHLREGACALGPGLILENSVFGFQSCGSSCPGEQVVCVSFRLLPSASG